MESYSGRNSELLQRLSMQEEIASSAYPTSVSSDEFQNDSTAFIPTSTPIAQAKKHY